MLRCHPRKIARFVTVPLANRLMPAVLFLTLAVIGMAGCGENGDEELDLRIEGDVTSVTTGLAVGGAVAQLATVGFCLGDCDWSDDLVLAEAATDAGGRYSLRYVGICHADGTWYLRVLKDGYKFQRKNFSACSTPQVVDFVIEPESQ